MKKLGVYVHIPFCEKKCKYCDFISFPCIQEEKMDMYFSCLIKEIKTKQEIIKKIIKQETNDSIRKSDFVLSTIYIGGGTPSIVNKKYIGKIIEELKKQYTFSKDIEITIEVNPGSADKEKLEYYKMIGINRLSIGLQSTSNRLLKLIGRIHSYSDFLKTYELAKEVGFTNINVDLMLALPTQTEDELEQSIIDLVKLNPNHISIYSLIVEENTVLEKEIEDGIFELPSEETERKMYWKAKKMMEENGYNHYEISNFAKKGFESNHNMDCWNQEEYLGFGLAAHSYKNSVRFSNEENLDKYISNIDNNRIIDNIIIEEDTQTELEKMKEYMLLGFRKINGISISEFERKFRINPLFYFRFEISKLTEEELIEVDLDNIKLTSKGIDLANLVFEEFI